MIYESYTFPTTDYRLLGKALKNDRLNIEKGDQVVLAPINNSYHHPANCYVYSIQTGQWLGRYKMNDFEVLKEFESIEGLYQYTQTQINLREDYKSKQEEKSPVTEDAVYEQLELF